MPARAVVILATFGLINGAAASPVAYRAVELPATKPRDIYDFSPGAAAVSGNTVAGAALEVGIRHVHSYGLAWFGPDHRPVFLHDPTEPDGSVVADGVFGDTIVGYRGGGYDENYIRAAMWTDGGTHFTSLHPQAGFERTGALGVWGDHQVGVGAVNFDIEHALLWSGSAASVVDLTPNADVARANAVYENHQVGVVGDRAALWSGTPHSLIDLNPDGFQSSQADGVWGDEQVGDVTTMREKEHAAVWYGSPQSAVVLRDGAFGESQANGVSNGVIVGVGIHRTEADPLGLNEHALLWINPQADPIDLGRFLPTMPASAAVYGIDADGVITGNADGRAVLWIPTTEVPLPSACYAGAVMLVITLAEAFGRRTTIRSGTSW